MPLAADTRSFIFLLLANAAMILSKGQNYAERGYVHADAIDITEDEDDYATEYYDWNHDGPEIRRWNVEDYPHPQLEPKQCQRTTSSNVCDPENILTEPQADELDAAIRQLYNNTLCICKTCSNAYGGIQIGIALLKHTYQPYNEHPSKIIHSFAKNLRSKWRLGECEDDLLIVVVTGDRQSYTDVGRTTQRYISHGEAYRIFLENRAYFSADQYFEGLRRMVQDYQTTTRFLSSTKKRSDLSAADISGIVIGTILVLLIFGIIAVWIYKRYKDENDSSDGKLEKEEGTKSSSWRRKDIKVLLTSLVTSNDEYKQCNTQEDTSPVDDANRNSDDEEIINTELVVPENVTKGDSSHTVRISEQSDESPGTSSSVTAEVNRTGDLSQDTEQARTDEPNHSANLQTFVPKTQNGLHQTDL